MDTLPLKRYATFLRVFGNNCNWNVKVKTKMKSLAWQHGERQRRWPQDGSWLGRASVSWDSVSFPRDPEGGERPLGKLLAALWPRPGSRAPAPPAAGKPFPPAATAHLCGQPPRRGSWCRRLGQNATCELRPAQLADRPPAARSEQPLTGDRAC